MRGLSRDILLGGDLSGRATEDSRARPLARAEAIQERAKPESQGHEVQALSGLAQAQALQERFGNHAVGQMAEIAARAGTAGPAMTPEHPPASEVSEAPPVAGGAAAFEMDSEAEVATSAEVDAEEPSAESPEPMSQETAMPVPEVKAEPGKESAVEPVPRAAEKQVAETSDKTRAAALGAFIFILAARPAAAPWSALLAAYAEAPKKAADEAAAAIGATLLALPEQSRKALDERLGVLERSSDTAVIIKLIRARLAAAPTVAPAEAPPDPVPPDG